MLLSVMSTNSATILHRTSTVSWECNAYLAVKSKADIYTHIVPVCSVHCSVTMGSDILLYQQEGWVTCDIQWVEQLHCLTDWIRKPCRPYH